MSIHWSDGASTIAATASAIAAYLAWNTSKKANQTAEAVARIERERWHAELTPQFNVSISRAQSALSLDVQLIGPLSLRQLDRMAIQLLPSDDLDRFTQSPREATDAEIASHVWGPYRFKPLVDGADEEGKTAPPVSLQVGRSRPFAIEETRPPFWQGGIDREGDWRAQWRGVPMRLRLTCRRDGFEPWVVPYDVETTASSRARTTT